ncbi:MAG TPA: GAF domain-containing protein [Vicinamibacterales bacterium]
MSIPLDSLAPCFQGLVPATLHTCSRDGIPNVALVSNVDYVDASHVALSYQFFNKSRRNIAENPDAFVRMFDPDTMQGYELRLRYVRSETSGPLFDTMALRIEAIASHSGLKGIFRLLAADVYEVLSVSEAIDEPGVPAASPARASQISDERFTLRSLQELSARINRARTLEELLESMLEAIEDRFGFRHSMVLLAGEEPGRLVTVASRGYQDNGAGAEVGFGEGIVGMVAEARAPIRISGLMRELLYAHAVAKRAQAEGLCQDDRRIPLPGLLIPESQLGLPLLVRDDLLGVLCLESEEAYRFHERDRAYFEVVANYLAVAIQNMLLSEREESSAEAAKPAAVLPAALPLARPESGLPRHEITYYRTDECIFVDGEYLIRSLPARLLWKILSTHRAEGRREFTNRELRLDRTLKLPEYKDNLESRLLLLRRRLEQKTPRIRLVPTGRGRFALDLACQVELVERQ